MLAWGPEGARRLVGNARASQGSGDAAKAGVQSVLGNVTLASVSNWARPSSPAAPRETYDWHFVDIPRNVATFDDSRDCFSAERTRIPGAATDHIELRGGPDYVFQASACRYDQDDRTEQAGGAEIHRAPLWETCISPFHAVGDARGGELHSYHGIFGTTIATADPAIFTRHGTAE